MTARIVTAIAGLLICCNVGHGGDCMTGSGVFQNREFPPQSDQFTVEFEATPLLANMNGVTTLSLGPVMNFDDCAILIRFREDGRIVVRNGDGYASDVDVLYTVGESHRFRVQVNVPGHRYSVWVNPPSGAEVQIAAGYDFRTSQGTVESLDTWGIWSYGGGGQTHKVCNFGMGPPILSTYVTSDGLMLVNAELMWIRSHDPMDAVELIVGSFIASSTTPLGGHLYFMTSECFQWDGDPIGCLLSEMRLGLTTGGRYDFVAWSETDDRREPKRQRLVIAEHWAFHPADINMDSVVDCADLSGFSSDPYDWNLSGQATDVDWLDLAAAVGASLADLDGDGMVGATDWIWLLVLWGSCPQTGQCSGDVNCDGQIGIDDLLLLASFIGL